MFVCVCGFITFPTTCHLLEPLFLGEDIVGLFTRNYLYVNEENSM